MSENKTFLTVNGLFPSTGPSKYGTVQKEDVLIQGTFGVIQGTFGVIQGTFGIIQGTFGIIQGTFGIIQGTFINVCNIPDFLVALWQACRWWT
jgi:hypothetical protein